MVYAEQLSGVIKYDPSLDGSQADYLKYYVKFYQKLSPAGQRKFLRRVKRFISLKDFEFFFDTEQDNTLIKTLIAAGCIQLTWGLDDTYLDSYSYIGVYQNGIKLKKGKATPLNALWIKSAKDESWDDLKEGHFFMGGGGRQIGLMEWTSVFIIEAKKDNILDDFFSAYYKVWCEAARDIMFVVDEDNHLPLDAFGKRLPMIIQFFFEDPEELKMNHPEIYEHTKRLLNLDLLDGAESDFVYSEKIKKEKKIRSSNRALIFEVQDQVRKFALPAGIMYSILWQMPVIIAVWFIMGRWTYFSSTFWFMFLTFSIIGIFLVYKFYYVKRGLNKFASLVLYIIGVIPFIYGGMSLLNYMIPIKHYTQRVKVDRLSDLEKDLPWSGFTKLHISKVIVAQKKTYKPRPYHADYFFSLRKGIIPQIISEKEKVVNQIVETYTSQRVVKGMASFYDRKNDIVEMHTYTGLFGAPVFHGFVITLID
jgi:hypothetical protein